MKRRLLLLLSAIVVTGNVTNADIIVKKDGTTLNVFNVERSSKSVIYTETADADAPLRKIPVEECFAIKIGDGEMVTIDASKSDDNKPSKEETTKTETAPDKPVMVEPVPSAENEAMIARINNVTISHSKKQPKDKPDYTDYAIGLLGITPGSILSDQNIDVTIEQSDSYADIDGHVLPVDHVSYSPNFKIRLKNKTKNKLYVDLSSSFRINDDIAEPYFTNTTVTNSSGSSSGASIGLGAVAGALGVGGSVGKLASGIGIGGGSSHGTSVTKTQDMILVIPPGGAAYLPKKIETNDKGDKAVENYDTFKPGHDKSMTKESIPLQKWQTTDLGESQMDFADKRIITYSTVPDFSQYTSIEFGVYLRALYGIGSFKGYQTRFCMRITDDFIVSDKGVIWSQETFSKNKKRGGGLIKAL